MRKDYGKTNGTEYRISVTLKEGRAVEDVMPLFSSGTLGTCTFNGYVEKS